jgi:hypothetical protein
MYTLFHHVTSSLANPSLPPKNKTIKLINLISQNNEEKLTLETGRELKGREEIMYCKIREKFRKRKKGGEGEYEEKLL